MRNKSQKYVFLIILIFLFFSCKRTHHEFYFDVKEQKVISCDNVPIYSLSINNDSIKANGFLYEGGIILDWEGDRHSTPLNFSFNKIPNEYHYFEGKSATSFKFKPNCKYTLEKSGGGSPSFKIRVWTDSIGKVYKTTHSICGLKTLEEDGDVNVPN